MTVNDQLTEAVEIYYSDKVQCDYGVLPHGRVICASVTEMTQPCRSIS